MVQINRKQLRILYIYYSDEVKKCKFCKTRVSVIYGGNEKWLQKFWCKILRGNVTYFRRPTTPPHPLPYRFCRLEIVTEAPIEFSCWFTIAGLSCAMILRRMCVCQVTRPSLYIYVTLHRNRFLFK